MVLPKTIERLHPHILVARTSVAEFTARSSSRPFASVEAPFGQGWEKFVKEVVQDGSIGDLNGNGGFLEEPIEVRIGNEWCV